MQKFIHAIIFGIYLILETLAKFLFVTVPSLCTIYVYITHPTQQACGELIFIYLLYIFIYKSYIKKDDLSRHHAMTKKVQFLLFHTISSFLIFPLILEISKTTEIWDNIAGPFFVTVMTITAFTQKGRNNLHPWGTALESRSLINTLTNGLLAYLAYQCYVLMNSFFIVTPIFIGVMVIKTIYKK